MILVQREYDEKEETSEILLTQTASHPLLLEEAEEAEEMVVLKEMVVLEEAEEKEEAEEMFMLEEAET